MLQPLPWSVWRGSFTEEIPHLATNEPRPTANEKAVRKDSFFILHVPFFFECRQAHEGLRRGDGRDFAQDLHEEVFQVIWRLDQDFQ